MSPALKIIIGAVLAALAIAATFQLTGSHPPAARVAQKRSPPKEGAFPDFRLSSPAFQNEGAIPDKYTCKGANISPRLEVAAVPSGTKSMTLLMDYIDPASGNISVYWLVWN